LQLFFFKHGIAEVVEEPPPEPPPYRFSGLIFGDYYGFPESHLPAFDDQHGFWLRRIYFTYDHTFSPAVSTRLRFEMNSNGRLEGGSLDPFVKDAYVRWVFHGRQALVLGIQPSLTFEHIDNVWGLRHIEKSPLDLYRVDSSRDTGVTVSGPFNESQTWKYAVQFGNESGSDAETNQFKGYRFAARYETNPGFTVEGFAAHFNRADDADRTTAQIFAAYRAPAWRAGFQYSFQKRRPVEGSSAADVDLAIVSGFGVADLKPQKFSVFARVDRYTEPCPDCDRIDYLPIATNAPFTMILAGVEYYLLPAVRFSPNVEWVDYSAAENGSQPANDTVVRMTFYWVW
jgi:hypothetical protein